MADAVHRFPLSAMARCRRCKGQAVVELRLHEGGTGYTVGGTHDHVPDCLEIVCPHKVPYSEVCDACEEIVSARERARGKDPKDHGGDHECG